MNYYIKIQQQEVPVTQEIYKIWQRTERKERYFREGDSRNGVFSYDALDCEDWNGCELFADPNAGTVEGQAELRLLTNRLRIAIDSLYPDERELISRIYFLDQSLRKISQKTGIPFTTLHYRHKRILKKLKNFIEHMF